MNIRSKYNVGDTVFIVQYNNFSGTYTCFNYNIKYIIYDGSDIFYGFVYGIEAMENFFRSVEMPTSLHELGLDLTDQQIHDLAFKCSFKDTRTIGVFKQLNMRDMEEIYLMAR